MTDQAFGALELDANGYWNGRIKLDFFGTEKEVGLMIDSCYESQTEISERQKESFYSFLKKWPELQQTIVKEIIRYYNEEERFSYGPDDPEEAAAWWPEIETVEEMRKWISLDSLVIESDKIVESCRAGKRCLYLLFSYQWAEDYDGNGIGIRLLNEEISQIGFQDIAF